MPIYLYIVMYYAQVLRAPNKKTFSDNISDGIFLFFFLSTSKIGDIYIFFFATPCTRIHTSRRQGDKPSTLRATYPPSYIICTAPTPAEHAEYVLLRRIRIYIHVISEIEFHIMHSLPPSIPPILIFIYIYNVFGPHGIIIYV